MSHKQLNLVMLLGLISGALSLSCTQCVKSDCNHPSGCIAGITSDVSTCGCCDTCAKNVDEVCGGLWDYYGTCGDGLTCQKEYLPWSSKFGNPFNQDAKGICIEGVCEDTWYTKNCLDSSQIPFDTTELSGICSCSDIKLSGQCETPLYGEQICMKTCGHHCGIERSWTPVTNACIRGYNSLILNHDLSMDDCKTRCQAQFDFMCRSVEYNAQGRRCVLSGGNSSFSSYMENCYLDGWTYTELIENV